MCVGKTPESISAGSSIGSWSVMSSVCLSKSSYGYGASGSGGSSWIVIDSTLKNLSKVWYKTAPAALNPRA